MTSFPGWAYKSPRTVYTASFAVLAICGATGGDGHCEGGVDHRHIHHPRGENERAGERDVLRFFIRSFGFRFPHNLISCPCLGSFPVVT